MEILDLLFLKAAKGYKFIEETTTGSRYLQFNTNAKKDLVNLSSEFVAWQTGSGDPSPSNERPINGVMREVRFTHTGKNQYDIQSYPLREGYWVSGGSGSAGSGIADDACTMDFIPCSHLAGKKITLNKRPQGNNPGFAFYSSDDQNSYLSGVKNSDHTAGTPMTVDVPYGAKYMRFTTISNDSNIQIEIGEESTTYEPFKQCTMHEILFPALSKNLYDEVTYPLSQQCNVSGVTGKFERWTNNYAATQNFIPCEHLAGKTVTLNYHANWATNVGWAFYSQPNQDSFISGIPNGGMSPNVPWTITIPSDAKYLRFSVPVGKTDVQIEYGSSYTGYEPYRGVCYGGTLDAINGVLTVKWFRFDAKYFEWETTSQTERGVFMCRHTGKNRNVSNGSNVMCNKYKTVDASVSITTMDDLAIKGNPGEADRIYIRDSNYTTLEDFMAAMDDVYFIYELEQPYEVQIDPVTIKTILGTNYIFNDWDLPHTVTYIKKA